MMEIFICEDEQSQRERLTEFVKNYLSFEQLDMVIKMSVGDPQQILAYIKNNKQTNGFYLLDIELETTMNGIELADAIRKYDKRGAIVFITRVVEALPITINYGVEAMGFIAKRYNFDEMKEEIITNIKRAQERLIVGSGKDEKRVTFKSRETGLISRRYSQIMFFETNKAKRNGLVMVCENETILFPGSISKIEKEHPHFMKFDQSTLINPDNVVGTFRSKGEIKMVNGDTVEGTERRVGKFHKSLENRLKEK